MMEIVLSYINACVFGTTGGPESSLLNRFQKQWDNTNKHEFVAAPLNVFSHPELGRLR